MFLGDGIAVNSIEFYRIHINGIVLRLMDTSKVNRGLYSCGSSDRLHLICCHLESWGSRRP